MDLADEAVIDSPVGFEFGVAYALHPEMRRLLILYIVGALLVPAGLSWTMYPPLLPIVGNLIGLGVLIVGATFLFGGLVGALFKLVTDANLLAERHSVRD